MPTVQSKQAESVKNGYELNLNFDSVLTKGNYTYEEAFSARLKGINPKNEGTAFVKGPFSDKVLTFLFCSENDLEEKLPDEYHVTDAMDPMELVEAAQGMENSNDKNRLMAVLNGLVEYGFEEVIFDPKKP
jgi:hypothetical protein